MIDKITLHIDDFLKLTQLKFREELHLRTGSQGSKLITTTQHRTAFA